MSTFDLVCAECGFRIRVAEKGTAGAKVRCPGCGEILEVPGSKHAEVPPGGKYTVRELPPYVPKHPERATPKSNREYVNLEVGGHVYSGLTREQAESIKRGIANGTFSGFRSRAQLEEERKRLGVSRNPDGSYNFGSEPPTPKRKGSE